LLSTVWSAALIAAAVLGTPAASAQTSADELARKHFDSAVAYFQEKDYENALKAFEKSYELSKRPEILLNIATVHEQRGELKAARDALKRYLETAPETDRTPAVKERLQTLEKRIEPEQPAATATTTSGPEVDAGVTPEPAAPFEPRRGVLGAGGIVLAPENAGSIGFRLDVGLPLQTSAKRYLRLLAVITFDHDSEAGASLYGLAPFATLQHGWRVLAKPKGSLSLLGEFGAGPIFAWFKPPDLPYMPGEWQSEVRIGARLAGAVEYQGHTGWLIAVQPIGVVMAIVDGDLDGTFELGLRAGYQF
jgi:hypothetical protein